MGGRKGRPTGDVKNVRGTGLTNLGEIVLRWLLPRRSLAVHRTGVVVVCLLAAFICGGIFSSQASAAPYAAMVVDGRTGKILYSRNGDALRYPASLTKIMTLYLLFDALEERKLRLSSRLKVSKHASRQPPSKLGLKPGQTIRVSEAIKALVTKSANDVAAVVAENLAGTEANFAKQMTAKARKIGMRRTVFKNASGLPDKKQITTARDMITLANHLMFDHPERYEYFSLKYFKYKGKRYRNHNRLLFAYNGTDGIKTGYTRASGFNLLANVHRDKKHLIGVVFGGRTSKWRNTRMMYILNKSLPRATRGPTKKRRLIAHKKPRESKDESNFPEKAAQDAVASIPMDTVAQGDADATVRLPKRKPAGRDGGFHIQVGAYARQTDAIERLEAVQKKAGDVIRGYTPLAVPHVASQRRLYRARFAGFTRNSADSTCDLLKKRAITCIVMSAQ